MEQCSARRPRLMRRSNRLREQAAHSTCAAMKKRHHAALQKVIIECSTLVSAQSRTRWSRAANSRMRLSVELGGSLFSVLISYRHFLH